MTGSRPESEFDWSGLARSHLAEASLRLLAALGRKARFPNDLAELEALLGRLAEGRPGEPMAFAVEPANELPRYSGQYMVWISPVGEGCLRLRHEGHAGLVSEAVTLRPDGRLGAFETIEGFGVPESDLTDQARADLQAVEKLGREQEAAEIEVHHRIEADQRRFRTEHLRRVVAGPPQDPAGPVVSFLALYETGTIVYYLTPRPSEGELETDDPWAEPLEAAMMPPIELIDAEGTVYEIVEADYLDPNSSPLRASQSFVPATPKTASTLTVAFESTRVEIDLGDR